MKTKLLRKLRKNYRIVPGRDKECFTVERWVNTGESSTFWKTVCFNQSFTYCLLSVHDILRGSLMGYRQYKQKIRLWP